MRYYIGIDPGVGGGLALLNEEGRAIATSKMPETDADLLALLRAWADKENPRVGATRAALEFVRSSPQMGVVSAFTFGRGYGALRMALCAAGIPYDEVTPQKWQAAIGCRSHGDKNVTKRRAQELFPGMTVTHAVADALLIAEWSRRQHERTADGR